MIRIVVLSLGTLALLAALAQAQPGEPAPNIGIEQRLNEKIPLDVAFRDEQGKTVTIGEYFGNKPVILILAYYRCPRLCSLVLNGLVEGLRQVDYEVGDQFTVVTVSIDPREQPELASAKKTSYVQQYGRPGAAVGWHFLTGDDAAIKRLAAAVGFKYAYDSQRDEFAHGSGIMMLTPDGTLSRYFYGIQFSPSELRFGLEDCSAGKIGSPVVRPLRLLCFTYDPVTGTYTLMTMRLMRIASAITVVAIVFFVTRACAERDASKPRPSSRLRACTRASGLGRAVIQGGGETMFAQVQLLPEQASTHASAVDSLLTFLFMVCGFFALLIAVLLTVFAIRYRRRSEADLSRPVASSLKLEVTWSLIPFAFMMVFFLWGAQLYFSWARPPDDVMEIHVVGRQWMWKMQQVGGQREINQLHVPVGRAVKLSMISEDVIHSFFVPAFRIHMDVLPGRYTTVWFKATKPGRYPLFCSQYCGTNHAKMIGEVIVMDEGEYQSWLNQGVDGSPATEGRKLFMKLQCSSCHNSDSSARGPNLEGVYNNKVTVESGVTVRADDAYIRESILYPDAKVVAGFKPIMPSFLGQVNEEEVLQLIAFIKSLEHGQMPPRTENAEPPSNAIQNKGKGKTP